MKFQPRPQFDGGGVSRDSVLITFQDGQRAKLRHVCKDRIPLICWFWIELINGPHDGHGFEIDLRALGLNRESFGNTSLFLASTYLRPLPLAEIYDRQDSFTKREAERIREQFGDDIPF